jgi:hypothetical protein
MAVMSVPMADAGTTRAVAVATTAAAAPECSFAPTVVARLLLL